MKKKLLKIFSVILICCISLLCVGCMGSAPGDYDGNSGGDGFLDSMVFDMFGSRVLYRPDTYDYNAGSGAESGQTNDYYGKYAYGIVSALYEVYGITKEERVSSFANLTINNSKIPYLYDSIRYKVDTVGTVTHRKTVATNEVVELSQQNQYILVGADLDTNWKWSFDYDLYDSNYNALLVSNDEYDIVQNNHIYNQYTDSNEFLNYLNDKYTPAPMTNFYTTAYLGTSDENDSANYSDFVKTLEYVVYSYALDLEPKTVTVTINDNATNIENLYEVSIQSFDSVDDALTDIKELFTKIGSYVGLIERQINKIASWIKTNVIGLNSNITNDNFSTYQNITEVVSSDGSISYEFDESNKVTGQLGRNYSNAVDNIVRAVCGNVSIGEDEDGSEVKIDNRFLASEVKEYAGETFFIRDDVNFPAPGTSTAATAIQPLEYQSVQLMPKEGIDIDEVWIALKYDAGLDGTIEGIYDTTKYLDIIVELNYYNHTLNKLFTVGSQKTRVFDGAYMLGKNLEANGKVYNDHGLLMFSNFISNCPDESIKDIAVAGKGIHLGQFNPDIGNGILKTDVGESGYSGTPLVSEDPRVLVGTTNVRKYYSIIEPVDEELGSNTTYITGRSNEKMYAGDDGCDYLEITYKVLKKKGDRNTNYKFYTGIAAVYDVVQ